MEALIIPLLTFAAVFLAVYGLQFVFRPGVASQRLESLSGSGRSSSAGIVRGATGGTLDFLQRIGEGSGDSAAFSELRKRLVNAGYPSRSAPSIYRGIRFTFPLAVVMGLAAQPGVWSLSPPMIVAALCGSGLVAWVIPSIVVDRKIARRRFAIERGLPDALDLMVVCVEAGFGINQALARVAEEFEMKQPILSREFALVVNETRAGKGTSDALRGLADRTGVSDVSALVALLVQTERFGTSVANALRVHAEAMRVRRMQRAEERAQKATLKLILPSVMIFAALLLIFLVPGFAAMFGAFGAE